jgi:Chaperone of endosialidase
MIYSNYAGRAACLLVFLPLMLTAQRAQENVVPLRNWITPLYWHPNQAESQVAPKVSPQGATPQLVFPGNAVSTDALTFVAITPCRLVDTRGSAAGFDGGVTPFNGPSLGPTTTTNFPVQSTTEATGANANTGPAACGSIPSIAEAYSLNVTVIPHAGAVDNYVTLWPGGSVTPPVVSTLNDPQGVTIANAAIIAAGTDGSVNLYNSGPATIDVIDMNGYFAAPTDLNENTAIGAGTLAVNTTGAFNTASGYEALQSNTLGSNNAATGFEALESNTIGSYNTANGTGAMASNTTGSGNTASGYQALQSNTTGSNNTADGFQALEQNTTGAGNIGIGIGAGLGAPAGNYDSIYIGSAGANGDNSGSISIGTRAAETTGTIQIGSAQVGGTSIAGIYGGAPTAGLLPVCVDANGRLGTVACGIVAGVTPSSLRFKEQVADIGDSSDKLLQLRPVTFLYKPQYDDGSHVLQYGLIAEEVAKLYPEMVGYGQDGQPSGIKIPGARAHAAERSAKTGPTESPAGRPHSIT